MKNFRFYKNDLGWFIDLPEWEGSVDDLQMVAGADTFLDVLSEGIDEIYVTLSNEAFEDCETLNFLHLGKLEGWEMGEGAWYSLNEYRNESFDLKMWLCDVTKFIFGEFPNEIYFEKDDKQY